MLPRAKPYLIAVLVLGIFFAGWTANGWRITGQHASELAERDRLALVVAEAIKQAGIEANNAISQADTKAWKGLEDDKKELRRLRGCVADGTCGVRLIAVEDRHGPDNPGSSSVGHDTVALDADVQRRVLDHREAIGEDAAKLSFLQAYARQCFKASSADSAASDTQSRHQELMATPLMQESAGQLGR